MDEAQKSQVEYLPADDNVKAAPTGVDGPKAYTGYLPRKVPDVTARGLLRGGTVEERPVVKAGLPFFPEGMIPSIKRLVNSVRRRFR
jgi:hypothetical protein